MKKIRKRAALDIDLTPLLDVVFIVLMVVMCSRQMDIKELGDELADARADIAAAEGVSWAEENDETLMAYVSLYADYEEGNPKTRHIRLAYEDTDVITNITITPETESEAYDDFRRQMTDFLKQHEDMPVMLVLNEDQILYRDKQELDKLLDELLKANSNLYQTEKKE